jgi:hypothetical protein
MSSSANRPLETFPVGTLNLGIGGAPQLGRFCGSRLDARNGRRRPFACPGHRDSRSVKAFAIPRADVTPSFAQFLNEMEQHLSLSDPHRRIGGPTKLAELHRRR